MPSSLSRPAARARLFAVLALVVALFAPSLGNTFAHDDRMIAKAVRDGGAPNVMVRELQPLGRYFTTNYWQGIDDRDPLYRPVTILSYAVLYAALGRHLDGEHGEAMPQHALNVVLHALATWLVYLLARLVRVRRGGAVLAALVFGVHALHSEVVAGVVGRAELLAFGFGALATLLCVRGCRAPGPRWPALAGAAVAFFLAFASKESAVAWAPFAAVMLLVRAVQQGPQRPFLPLLRGRLGAVVVTAGAPLAAFLLLRQAMLAHIGADPSAWSARLEHSTAGWWVGNGLVQWAYGLVSCVLPLHLSADHGPAVFAPTTSLASPRVLGALALLAAPLALGLLAWRRQPWLFLAAATFFGHSFLTANVAWRIGTDYAERLYYTPSLGLSFAVAWLAARPWRVPRWIGAVMLALWLLWNAGLVVQRNGVWRDDPTLLAHEVVNQPRSARMHLLHAAVLQQRGEQAATVAHLARVVELFPDHAEAWNQLGADQFRAGRHGDARACFERSLAAGYFEPRQRVNAAINLVAVLLQTGDVQAVAAPLERALATDPTAVAARVPDLRRHLTGKVPYAWLDAYLARAQAAAPAAQAWAYHRAWLAYESKAYRAAAELSTAALGDLRGQPQQAEMKIIAASSLASSGNLADARRLAEQLLADPGTPPGIRDNARDLLARLR